MYGSPLNNNTEYWIKVVVPFGDKPYMQYSTNGTDYTTVATYDSAVSLSTTTSTENLKIGVGSGAPFIGTIYADDTYIEINSVKVWNMAATTVPSMSMVKQ